MGRCVAAPMANVFQVSESTLLYCLEEGALQMSARRLAVAAAVLNAEGGPTFFLGDQGGSVFEFARVGGGVAA